MWSLEEQRFAHLLDTGQRAVEVMAFAPDGRYLINGGQTPDMMIWNADTAALAARLPGVGSDRISMAFSPDGEMLVTSVLGRGVTLWNLTTITDETVNNAVLDTGDTLILDVDWSADSQLLMLFGAMGSIYVWGIPAGA
jgi:WD40 repeat protein